MSKFAEISNITYQQIPKHADVHVIRTEINIKKLEDIIRVILREYCDVNVLGFNNSDKFYWCKIEENKRCILYTEIKLVTNDDGSSLIIIINESDLNLKYVGIDKKKHKKIFIDNITEGLYFYQNSAFCQYYIESCCS